MRPLADGQAAGRYTSQQIEAAILRPNGWTGVRFDVLDQNLRPTPISLPPLDIGASDPLAGGVTAAVVDWDSTRAIRKSLALTMFPSEPLRSAALRYWIRPWLQIGPMPDGGTAEIQMGVFLWNLPTRTITQTGAASNAETWTVTLGDRQYLLDLHGPGPSGIQFAAGMRTTDAIAAVLALAGITDTSQIQPSSATLAQTLSFSMSSGDTQSHPTTTMQQQVIQVLNRDPAGHPMTDTYYALIQYYYRVWSWNAHHWIAPPPQYVSETVMVPVTTTTTAAISSSPDTLAKILDYLHTSISYDLGYFDLEDRWVARPVLNPAGTQLVSTPQSTGSPVFALGNAPGSVVSSAVQRTPTITYTAEPTAPDAAPNAAQIAQRVNLLLGPPTATPDPTKFANRVMARSTAPSAAAVPVAWADLDTVMPNHPRAHINTGVWVDATITDATVAAGDLPALALSTLLTRALTSQIITLDTFAYPSHEGYELVGVRIPGDAEFGSASSTAAGKEQSWSIDLFSGRMHHVLQQAF